MGEEEVKIKKLICERCGYKWLPKSQNKKPKVCPKCHNAWWDTPKKGIEK